MGNFDVINNNWLRKRWLDFRNGHGIYLIFIMTFACGLHYVLLGYSFLTPIRAIKYSIGISSAPSIQQQTVLLGMFIQQTTTINTAA